MFNYKPKPNYNNLFDNLFACIIKISIIKLCKYFYLLRLPINNVIFCEFFYVLITCTKFVAL